MQSALRQKENRAAINARQKIRGSPAQQKAIRQSRRNAGAQLAVIQRAKRVLESTKAHMSDKRAVARAHEAIEGVDRYSTSAIQSTRSRARGSTRSVRESIARSVGQRPTEGGVTVATQSQKAVVTKIGPANRGFVSAPVGKRLTRAESIKSEQQQAAKAQAAFTTTKQKIEAGRVAKAQVMAEARGNDIDIINANAQVITRMISPREQVEAISRGEVEPSFIGQFSAEKYYQSTLSGSTASLRPSQSYTNAVIRSSTTALLLLGAETVKGSDFIGPKKPKEKQDNGFLSSLYSTLRYSDPLDKADVKPQGLEWFLYGASRGLRPFYNIPLSVAEIAGQKTDMQPTLGSTVFEKGYKQTVGNIMRGNYLGALLYFTTSKYAVDAAEHLVKDPASVLELPAEAALWLTGGKAIQVGAQAFKKYSSLVYQSKKLLIDEKPTTILRSLTWKDKPLISLQEGKLVKGYKPELIPLEKIGGLGRSGYEGALGSGMEKEIFYSTRALTSQVQRKIIPQIAKERAESASRLLELTKEIKGDIGAFGKTPIKGLTQKQSDYLLSTVVKEQKAGTVELVHGSTALKPQIAAPIRKEAGSSLQLGDIDVVPKGKDIEKIGTGLIERFAKDFPLEKGQKLQMIKPFGKNKALILKDSDEERKIFEVVIRGTKDSESGLTTGSKILGYNIPEKASVKAKDIPVKLHTARFQQLTQGKQVLAYQIGSKTSLDIFTSSGRTKDIVRFYWKARSDAFITGGEKGKVIEKEAEHFRALYDIEFTNYKPEKVLLYSSRITSEPSSKLSGIIQTSPKTVTPSVKEESPPSSITSKIVKDKTFSNSRLTSSGIQPRVTDPVMSSWITSSKPSRLASSELSSKLIGSDIPSILSSSGRFSIKTPSIKTPSIKTKSPPSSMVLTPSKPPSIIKQPSIKTTSSKGSISKAPSRISPSTKLGSSRLTAKPAILITRLPPRPIIAGVIWRSRISKPKPRPRKYRKPFLGNVHIEEITGFRTKYTDLDVGKKVERLARKDVLSTRKRKNKSLFGKKKGGLLF